MNSKLTLQYSNLAFPFNYPIVDYVSPTWILSDEKVSYLHCHNCLEIGYCCEGEGIFSIEGKEKHFHSGDICVICPNTMHISRSKEGTSSEWKYLYVDVRMLLNDYLVPQMSNLSVFQFDSPDFPNIIAGNEFPRLKSLLCFLFDDIRDKKENYRVSSSLLCISFLLELLRVLPEKTGSEFTPIETRLTIYPALQYIENNYMEAIRIEVLAKLCFLSETHFRRMFKSIMQVSPLDYINRIRIQKALELLYNTEDSIVNIALCTGYSDEASFNRNFSRIMGITPLKWRKKTRSYKKDDMIFSIIPSSF